MFVEIEIKKSRFLAYKIEIEEFEAGLKRLKKEHKKARHFAWAYRYKDKGVLKEKAFDDGEPSGTAGRPILRVMQQRNIKGVAIVVVRYFGGMKLGAGGLVRAYAKAASALLQESVDR